MASSLFARPSSPPPRIPSPPAVFTALASPCSRSHRKPSSSSSSSVPTLPPGLVQERTLLTVRSCEHFSRKNELASHRQPKRTRSALGHPTSSNRANSLPEPLTLPVSPHSHRRSLSVSLRSSPPLPAQPRTPPPPVPPIPSFILATADKKPAPTLDPLPVIYLPELEPISPISDLPASVLNSRKPALTKRRFAGMTCLKFFSLRNSLKSN